METNESIYHITIHNNLNSIFCFFEANIGNDGWPSKGVRQFFFSDPTD